MTPIQNNWQNYGFVYFIFYIPRHQAGRQKTLDRMVASITWMGKRYEMYKWRNSSGAFVITRSLTKVTLVTIVTVVTKVAWRFRTHSVQGAKCIKVCVYISRYFHLILIKTEMRQILVKLYSNVIKIRSAVLERFLRKERWTQTF
jgi:hypothetical protein